MPALAFRSSRSVPPLPVDVAVTRQRPLTFPPIGPFGPSGCTDVIVAPERPLATRLKSAASTSVTASENSTVHDTVLAVVGLARLRAIRVAVGGVPSACTCTAPASQPAAGRERVLASWPVHVVTAPIATEPCSGMWVATSRGRAFAAGAGPNEPSGLRGSAAGPAAGAHVAVSVNVPGAVNLLKPSVDAQLRPVLRLKIELRTVTFPASLACETNAPSLAAVVVVVLSANVA